MLPHLVRREVVREEARRLGVAGHQVEDALVGRRGALGCVQLLALHAGEAQQRRHLLVLLRGLGGEVRQRPDEVFPSLVVAQDPLEQELPASVPAVELQGFLQERLDALPILLAPEAVGHFGGAHQQRATEGRIAPALRLLHVALDQVPPLAALRLGALDRLLGHRVAGAKLGEALVGGAGAGVVEQVLVEGARPFGDELRLAIGALGRLCLDGQQPGHGSELAPRFVRATGGLEQLAQLVGLHVRLADRCGERVPGVAEVRIVLQQPEGALDGLGAHPTPVATEATDCAPKHANP